MKSKKKFSITNCNAFEVHLFLSGTTITGEQVVLIILINLKDAAMKWKDGTDL
jgi:hypothetical protein